MNYDLFLSDFDGTLVQGGGKVCQKNIQAIEDYRAQGGVFAVVTGRMLASILPRLKELGLQEGLVVACQGAVIADIATGRLLRNEGFSTAEASRIAELLEGLDLHFHVYSGDNLYCNRRDDYLKTYESVCGVTAEVPDTKLSEFVRREGLSCVKILAMCEPEARDPLLQLLKKELPEYGVTTSSAYMTEILPKNVSKADAVAFLSKQYGIPTERTAAIGDERNDLPMLLAAGGRFAVKGAAEELTKIAVIVSSAEEGGVAEAIRYYAMGECR